MSKLINVKKIINNDYLLSIITRIISVIISIFHAAFLARFLGPELKGVSASITSIVSIGYVILSFGIHQAFPYYRRKDSSQNFLNRFCSNIVILYIGFALISVLLFFNVSADIVVKGSILLIPLYGYETIMQYIFLIESPKSRNLSQVTANTLETITLLFFWLFLKPNNFLMILGLSIAIIIKAVVATIKLKFRFDIRLLSINYIKDLAKFGFLPMIALLLTMLNSRVDILMLNAYSTVSHTQIGFYAVGVGLAEKALLIPDAIREILLSKLVAGKEKEEVARACRIGVAISIFISIFVILIGKYVIEFLYGEEYLSSYSVTLVSSLGMIFMVFIKMVSQYNIVHKKQKTNTLLLLLPVAINVIFNLILIPRFGIDGAAVSTFIGHSVCGVCFMIFFMKLKDVKLKDMCMIQNEDLNTIKLFLKKSRED